MKLVEIIHSALAQELINEDGESLEISLLAGLTPEQISAFETKIGFTLSPDIRELLEFTNGIEGGSLEAVDFTSSNDYVSIEEKSEFGWMTLGIAADGYGNHWGYVLSKNSRDLGPIYYFCHDAPVFLYQSPNLAHFLTEMFKMCRPPFKSLIDDVHEDRLKEVWLDNPDLVAVEDARAMDDEVISDFALTLPDGWKLIDLREPEIGAGFSWGRCKEFRRHPDEMIFALHFKEPGRFSRWLRRLTKRRQVAP
jgi:hypothetical protein